MGRLRRVASRGSATGARAHVFAGDWHRAGRARRCPGAHTPWCRGRADRHRGLPAPHGGLEYGMSGGPWRDPVDEPPARKEARAAGVSTAVSGGTWRRRRARLRRARTVVAARTRRRARCRSRRSRPGDPPLPLQPHDDCDARRPPARRVPSRSRMAPRRHAPAGAIDHAVGRGRRGPQPPGAAGGAAATSVSDRRRGDGRSVAATDGDGASRPAHAGRRGRGRRELRRARGHLFRRRGMARHRQEHRRLSRGARARRPRRRRVELLLGEAHRRRGRRRYRRDTARVPRALEPPARGARRLFIRRRRVAVRVRASSSRPPGARRLGEPARAEPHHRLRGEHHRLAWRQRRGRCGSDRPGARARPGCEPPVHLWRRRCGRFALHRPVGAARRRDPPPRRPSLRRRLRRARRDRDGRHHASPGVERACERYERFGVARRREPLRLQVWIFRSRRWSHRG